MNFLISLLVVCMFSIRLALITDPISPWRRYLKTAKTPFERVLAISLMIPIFGEFILLMYGLFSMFNWIFENAGEED